MKITMSLTDEEELEKEITDSEEYCSLHCKNRTSYRSE